LKPSVLLDSETDQERRMPKDREFQGEIVVKSRIVDYLSSGLYASPAACLKELINNSFDADATRVDMFVKPDADRIIIEDDGHGMDRAEFEREFRVITESHKREESDLTLSGRPKIGRIGIGFIAANEICDVMEIVSTKCGSSELLNVAIRFDLMRKDLKERARDTGTLAKADYHGVTRKTDTDSHFTQLFLKDVRGEAQQILAGAGSSQYAAGEKSIYGLKPESVSKLLKDKNLRTWSEFDAYSKNRLQVALNVPVRYCDDWLPASLRSQVDDIARTVARLSFSLYFDGSEVRKPIIFAPQGRALVSRFEFEGEDVAARGYFYAQHGSIRPQELQGLLIRIRNAAVGTYDRSFMGFSSSLGPLFQSWISGEIMADDRLEEAMNIDRRTLRMAHPAYAELQAAVHEHLSDLIKDVRMKIYSAGSGARRTEQAREVEKRIMTVATKEIASKAPGAARKVKKAWEDATTDKTGQKRLLRKYTVDQLYELVMEVAEKLLNPKQLGEFITRLTDRLRR
jgi:hypothetical protein